MAGPFGICWKAFIFCISALLLGYSSHILLKITVVDTIYFFRLWYIGLAVYLLIFFLLPLMVLILRCNSNAYICAVSIIMFSSFEHSVDLLYRKVIQKKKEDCSRAQQLGVTCMAGYASGAVGTFVSTPADNIVASLYNKKANNVFQVIYVQYALPAQYLDLLSMTLI